MEELKCKTILSKKLLVLRFLLFLGIFCIIFFINENTSKAYTIYDLIDYAAQVKENNNAGSNLKQVANKILANTPILTTNFGDINATTFFVEVGGSSDYELYFTANKYQIYRISNGFVEFNGSQRFSKRGINPTTNQIYNRGDSVSVSSLNPTRFFGLIESSNNFDWSQVPATTFFNNNFIDTTPLEFDQDLLNIVSYNGSLARYYQRRRLQLTRNICWKNNTK